MGRKIVFEKRGSESGATFRSWKYGPAKCVYAFSYVQWFIAMEQYGFIENRSKDETGYESIRRCSKKNAER